MQNVTNWQPVPKYHGIDGKGDPFIDKHQRNLKDVVRMRFMHCWKIMAKLNVPGPSVVATRLAGFLLYIIIYSEFVKI